MFQHNRQHIATRGTASVSTARKLIASSQQPAPSILRSTILDESIEQAVSARIAFKPQVLAGLEVVNGVYYLVASPKFTHRYYVVVKHDERYICSSRDDASTEALHQSDSAISS